MSLPHAVDLAATLGVGITLLRITPPRDYYRHHLSTVEDRLIAAGASDRMSADDLVAADAREVAAYLSDLKDRLSDDDAPEVTAEHLQGQNIAQAIIDKAAEQPALVAMTTHGRSGIGRLVLGSVTDRVVRHSNAPVLVVR